MNIKKYICFTVYPSPKEKYLCDAQVYIIL